VRRGVRAGGFFAFFVFFCLHAQGVCFIFIGLQSTKSTTNNLAAGMEKAIQGEVQARGQGRVVPIDLGYGRTGGADEKSAAVAQSVERVLGKDEVLGSNPSSS
jgi:hypothetical protein